VNETARGAHSKIGASSMHRWSQCPGSVRLSSGIESSGSRYAEEGTKAHEVASNLLLGRSTPHDFKGDDLQAIWTYVHEVQEAEAEAIQAGGFILVEHCFDLSQIHPGLFGTADAVIYNPQTKLLQVFDYKHGAGIPVEVEDNEQLLYYGLGALLSTHRPCKEVELIIVQPRCVHPDGPVRRWRFESFKLLDFAADLKRLAEATEESNAALKAGEHCRFCPAAGVCPEIHGQAIALAASEFSPVLSYDPKGLAEILAWLPTLEGYCKNVREFAYREAEHGRCPPGFKLVQKRATRRWKNEEVALIKLQTEFDLDGGDVCDISLKSPAQIERLVPKEKWSELSTLIVAESSGYTLAPQSDRREAAKLDAAHEFTVIENQ
jgi:hypothetical protein